MAHPLRHLIFAVGRLSCRRRGACKPRALRLAGLFTFIPTVLAVSLSAQPPRPAEQSLRFTVFSAQPVAGLSFTPRPGVASTKLVFYSTARSPRYEYRGAMPLRFTDAASGAVFAEAVVPPEIHDALLLFAAVETAPAPAGKPANGLRYQVSVLDDSAVRHASGGLAIINFSGLELSGTIGKTSVTLQSGLNPTMKVSRTAKILLRTTLKGRSFQSYAGDLMLKKNERALLILFPPFYKGSLEVQSRLLVDEPPEPPAPAHSPSG